MKGFHLVANQLHQYPTSRPLVEACLYFLLGHPLSSSEPLPLDGSAPDPGMLPSPAPNPFTNHAAVLLLAILENSIHNYDLCRDMLRRLVNLPMFLDDDSSSSKNKTINKFSFLSD